MIAKVYSAIPDGYTGHIVEVEADACKSLPGLSIVGMANKTVSEARERVRSAITNSGFSFPRKKVTVNLAPADLTKTGSYLDLPIALSILLLSEALLPDQLEGRLFVGELSLDGYTKPVHGIINIVEAARTAGFHEVYVPEDNFAQARLVPDITIHPVHSLADLHLALLGVKLINEPEISQITVKSSPQAEPLTFDQIRGQSFAKRALTIALAGHHNILLSGPPGAGKTLLARASASLLPPPTPEECIEITKIHSLVDNIDTVATSRPFRSPHHTASTTSLIGGGASIIPGEISLAHNGILFLDELPEYPRASIESLRQPIEDHTISIARAKERVTFPANFMLIATMNPCPCGYYGDPTHECTCSTSQIEAYQSRISGPILDRIDLFVEVERVPTLDLVQNTPTTRVEAQKASKKAKAQSHSSASQKSLLEPPMGLQGQIKACLDREFSRYGKNGYYNSSLTPKELSRYAPLTPAAEKLLRDATERLNLSARAYFRAIRVARTIADLANRDIIDVEHISEALTYRKASQ